MQKILAALIGAAVVLLGGVVLRTPSPSAVAVRFVQALPNGRLSSTATPELLENTGFRQALSAWRQLDRSQRLVIQPGPTYADVEMLNPTSATIAVVSHYVEVYPDGRALNWEQDYSLSMSRGLLGPWRVSGVHTMAQAVVQVLGGYSTQGQTSLIVPISVYLPTARHR